MKKSEICRKYHPWRWDVHDTAGGQALWYRMVSCVFELVCGISHQARHLHNKSRPAVVLEISGLEAGSTGRR